MPTKPGSCGLPYYGIEFAVLDPVVSVIDAPITALPYHALVICDTMLRLLLSIRF
jgi:hypothetical protein